MDKAVLGICIFTNQRQRNKALGVTHDTQLLRGLSGYVRSINRDHLKADTELIIRAAWLKALIDVHVDLSERLTAHIIESIDDPDTRREGVYAMSKLESYISHLGNEFEALL